MIITIVKGNIKSYLNDIFAILKLYWDNPVLFPQVITVKKIIHEIFFEFS